MPGHVADRPERLSLDMSLRLAKKADEIIEEVGFCEERLDLTGGACSDVGEDPADFSFAERVFCEKHSVEIEEEASFQDFVGVEVVAVGDVADDFVNGRDVCFDFDEVIAGGVEILVEGFEIGEERLVEEFFEEFAAAVLAEAQETVVFDVDFLVGVEGVDKRVDGSFHFFDFLFGGSDPAGVGETPDDVFPHVLEVFELFEQFDEVGQNLGLNDFVSETDAVSDDVAQTPDGLFHDLRVGVVEDGLEQSDDVLLDHGVGLLTGP